MYTTVKNVKEDAYFVNSKVIEKHEQTVPFYLTVLFTSIPIDVTPKIADLKLCESN